MFITVHDKAHSTDSIILRLNDIIRVMPLDGNFSRVYLASHENEYPVQVVDCWESVDEIGDIISEAQES